MRMLQAMFLIWLLAQATMAAAENQPNPLTTHNKMVYGVMKKILIRSAEKMPAEHYAFKPAESVRTFGQIVGHIADAQYRFCSVVIGEKNPSPNIEKTRTKKAELIAALTEAGAYCDKAYDGMTDASAVEMVKFFGSDAPRIGVLNVNANHTMEHYGNLVTYLRMKDVVPPTSEPDFLKNVR